MKPILFNTDDVRAILDGRKTVTRRVIKPQPVDVMTEEERISRALSGFDPYGFFFGTLDTELLKNSPYHPGNILYVRETWSKYDGVYIYKTHCRNKKDLEEVGNVKILWSPSIHMPKEAARIFLRLTGVKAERVRDITEEQARAEGFPSRIEFLEVFFKMYPDCTEDSWVRVISFERISKEEAQKDTGRRQ